MVNVLQNARNTLALSPFSHKPVDAVEWRISGAPVAYEEAVETMEARATAIAAGREPELVWLLEHPALYTSGTSANAADLLDARFPVFATGRGGKGTLGKTG